MLHELAEAFFRPWKSLQRSYRAVDPKPFAFGKWRIGLLIFLLGSAFLGIVSLCGVVATNGAASLSPDSSVSEVRAMLYGLYIVGYGSLTIAAYCFLLAMLHLISALRDVFIGI